MSSPPSGTRYNRRQLEIRSDAVGWLVPGAAVVLDLEGTGLQDDAEIVEVCILDTAGQILLDTLVRPTNPIPAEATLIHGITDSMVEHAPSWEEVHPQVLNAIAGRSTLTYGIGYDYKLLKNTACRLGLPFPEEHVRSDEIILLGEGAAFQCVMRAYAALWQEPTKHDRNSEGWRWKKLSDACRSQGISGDGAHRAKADANMTLSLIKAMASSPNTWTDYKRKTAK